MIDIQDVKKRQKKKGNRGFEMRKSVSVEHLYEDAEFGDRRGASRRRGDESRSASNSPQVKHLIINFNNVLNCTNNNK